MRLLLIAALALLPVSAHGACKDEVLGSLDKQRKSKAFRMETSMISEQGPVAMIIDYVPPGRMHQVVTTKVDNKTTETLLVDQRAWSKAGGPWEEAPKETASMLSREVKDILGDSFGAIGTVACLGTTKVDGRDLMVYRIENDAVAEDDGGLKEVGRAAKEKAAAALTDENRLVRMFYIDPETGLPARSLFAVASKLDRPISKATYSYPADLSIEPPAK